MAPRALRLRPVARPYFWSLGVQNGLPRNLAFWNLAARFRGHWKANDGGGGGGGARCIYIKVRAQDGEAVGSVSGEGSNVLVMLPAVMLACCFRPLFIYGPVTLCRADGRWVVPTARETREII